MTRKNIQTLWLSLVLPTALFMVVVSSTPSQAQGVWPPFMFTVKPVYQAGQITYNLFFLSYLEGGDLVDLDIRIPLPEGTRYVAGNAQESTEVSFDGQEVSFFTSVLKAGALPNASFVVEVIDPTQEIYTTQPWLAWKGQQPGDYLAKPVEVDLTKPAVNWSKWPFPKRLLLEASAVVADEVVTYYIFPLNYGGRMWDVIVNLPIPEGATFISAEPSGPFAAATFDGREVSFKAAELPQREQHPLQVKVSTKGVTSSALVTHAWAQWRNVGLGAGHFQSPKTDIRTGDLIVQPHTKGWVMADSFDDVPFGYYDVSSLAVQDEGDMFEAIFYTRDPLDPAGQPLLFVMYINPTCRPIRQYRLIYNHRINQAVLQSWNATTASWGEGQPVESSQAGPRKLVIQLPKTLLGNAESFCSLARVINTSQDYSAPLETEAIPDRTHIDSVAYYAVLATLSLADRIGYYRAAAINLEKLETVLAVLSPEQQTSLNPDKVETAINYLSSFSLDEIGPFSRDAQDLRDNELLKASHETRLATQAGPSEPQPGATPPPAAAIAAGLSGKLAIPLDSGQGFYNLHLLAMPTGQEIARIPDAHQPDFNYDGQRLLFDREGSGVNYIYEYNLPAHTEVPVTDIPHNEYPIYDLWGNRVAYGNTGLTLGRSEWARDENGDLLLTGNSITVEDALELLDDLEGDMPEFTPPELPGQPVEVSPYARHGFSGVILDHIRDEIRDHIRDEIRDQIGDEIRDYIRDEIRDQLGDAIREEIRDELLDQLGDALLDHLGDAIWDQLSEETRNQILHKEFTINLPYVASYYRPFMYVQCSLTPSQQEEDDRCQNVAAQGILYPDQMSEIQGRYPVWTANDMIVYNGCNTWSGSMHCGIYAVPAASTKRSSDGITPVRLTDQSSDLPADSQGGLITFTSRRDGNWEAYVMNLDGRQVLNLSQSPTSNDGLPAISPDGQTVAFVSDRSGRWAVWVVPATGGQATHVFDLPPEIPWAEGNRAWYTERISWGPDTATAPATWQPAPTPDYQALYPTPVAPANAISLPKLPATVEAQATPEPAPTAPPAAPISIPTSTPIVPTPTSTPPLTPTPKL